LPHRRPPNDSGSNRSHSGGQRGSRRGNRGNRSAIREPEAPPPSDELRKLIHQPLAPGAYIVFDIESTGGNPEKNGITEIFAIRFEKGEVKDTFYSMVNPMIPIPPIVRRMTGISNAMVKDAPLIEEVMPDFLKFIGDDVLVSHNTIGDLKFIRHFAREACGVELPNFFLCTHLLVDRLTPEAPNKSLKGLAKFFGLPAGDLHRAEADAYLTLELFKVLLKLLDDRSVKRIDEAIRLQGDMESALRLSWGIPPDKLKNLPPGPGVFFMYDYERKVLFLSSAISVAREVAKLQKYDLVPRQLLKTVLRAYDMRVERFANVLEALMHECDSLASSPTAFSPVDWHQRFVPAYCLDRRGDETLLRVGEIGEGTFAAFGPVTDRRIAMDRCIAIARAFGGELGEQGAPNGQVKLAEEQVSAVTALFEGRLASFIDEATRERRRRFLELLFRPAARQAINLRVGAGMALLKVEAKAAGRQRLQPLMSATGLAIVPDSVAGSWQVYEVVRGRPRMLQHLRGEWKAKLHQGGLAKRLHERLVREDEALEGKGVSAQEATRVNCFLWWQSAQAGREDSIYLPLEEILSI
jgi:DNA polymerase III epsilon subunit family exonuclease